MFKRWDTNGNDVISGASGVQVKLRLKVVKWVNMSSVYNLASMITLDHTVLLIS